MRVAWCGLLVVGTAGCGIELRPHAAVPDEVAPPVAIVAADEPDARPTTKPRTTPLTGDDCTADPDVCVAAGVRLTRTDLASAARKFAGACEAGSPVGCGNYAVLLRDGRGLTADPERAETLMRTACSDGDARACDELRLR